MVEENKNKKPMDIVAEQKLEKWLKDVGLSDNMPLDARFIESPIAHKGFDGVLEMKDWYDRNIKQKEGADTDKEAE